MPMYYDRKKYIPFTNELANGIYFRSVDSELTFEHAVELVSVNLLASLPGTKV